MGEMELRFPSAEAQAAGGYKRGGDNTPQSAVVVKAVVWESGEVFDHGKQETVSEGHFRLLDGDDRIVGHGDGYLGGAHARKAVEGLVADFDATDSVTIEEGEAGTLAPEDAALGKSSATGMMHCPSCGAKVPKFEGRCDMCGDPLTYGGGE